MDAITLLKQDHKTVEGLFKKFQKAGEGAKKTQQDLADRIVEELSVHTAIEEQVFYPAVREALEEEEDTILEGIEEHHIAKVLLSEISNMDPEDERFRAKVTVLIESVRHHVEEEEKELFPEVRKALGRKKLGEIGDQLEEAKQSAPKLPDIEVRVTSKAGS
jgi:hemerythrin-like domain-containing protein